MNSAKENAIGLYMEGIRDGNPRAAVERYTGARYTQHSTGVADGVDGFVAFFEPFIAANPQRDIRVLRALQDGSKIFVHAQQSLNGGSARWVTMDFFESDDDGKIVEHWDVIEADAERNGVTKVGGATNVGDHGLTNTNKELVTRFVAEILIDRRLELADKYIDAANFRSHGTQTIETGREFLEGFAVEDSLLSFQELFMLVGEGDFVATLNRARWAEEEMCRVDLFRIEAGRIVEHWDAMEPVPPQAEWANGGKF